MQRKTCPTCHVAYPARLDRCPEDGTALEAPGLDDAPWTAGKLIGGKYVIFSQTGSTEVAACYRARSLDLDQPRTLRALRPRFARQKSAAREFRRAAALLASIRHPSVAPVEFEGETGDGVPFVATEVSPGRSLAELIEAEAPLPPLRVCSIARQIAAALDAAHRRGLFHLGLNPSVVFVSGPRESESVRVEDFGADYPRMTQFIDGVRRSGVTLRDLMPANMLYCSPEQALGRHVELLDARSDLYSLGVIMFQMLTGRLPFSGGDANGNDQSRLEWLVAHLDESVDMAPAGDAHVPEPLLGLIRQLVEKQQQLRPPAARQVIETLGLVEDRIATRSVMGLRAEPSIVRTEAGNGAGELAAPVASKAGQEATLDETPRFAPPLAGPRLDAVELNGGHGSLPEAPFHRSLDPAPGLVSEAASASAMQPASRSEVCQSSSVLFNPVAVQPQGQRRRWAIAALALLIVVAGVSYLIIHGVSPSPGPLSPAKPDELPSAVETNQPAAPNISSAAKSARSTPPSQTSGQSATSTASSGAPVAAGSTTPSPPGAMPPVKTGAAAPAQAASRKPEASRETTAEINRAVAAGDVFFEQGKYDLAIQTYERPLKADPENATLRSRIARAHKAKVAEEEYLGQP